MTARSDGRREGRRTRRLLPVLLSALIVAPSDPFVASASAQAMSAAEGASRAVSFGASGAAVTAAGAALNAPAPLTLTPQAFAAPLAAGSLVAAPAASRAETRAALASPAAPALLAAALPAARPAPLDAAPQARAAEAAGLPAAPAAADGPARSASAEGSEHARSRDAGASADDGAEAAAPSALFDGAKPADAEAIKFFLIRPGQEPIAATLSSLDSVLKAHPEAAAGLNKKGLVRLVLGNRSAEELTASPEFKAKYPAALGVPEVSPLKQAWGGIVGNPLLKLVALPFKLIYRALKPGAKDQSPQTPAARPTLRDVLALPGKAIAEARFLGRTFRDSMTRPLPSEVAGGIATKSFPLTTSIGVYWTTVGMAHPFAMVGLMALSLFQETFHGIFLNTWNNFQESLSRLRGFSYQMYFNLAYMQGFGAMYRALSWSANPNKTIPPWSPFYWKDVLVMSLVGTFFGTLGYNGLNTLYAKGRLKRWQRSGIQQLRDVLFLLAGPFFATGSMHAFWALFIFQQALDLTIALIAWRLRTRTILYAVAPGDAGKDAARDAAAKLAQQLKERGVTAPVTTEKLTVEASKTEASR